MGEWAAKDVQRVYDLARTCATLDELASKLGEKGVTGSIIRHRIARLRKKNKSLPKLASVLGVDIEPENEFEGIDVDVPEHELDAHIDQRRAKRRARELARANKALHRRLEEAEERLEAALAITGKRPHRAIEPLHPNAKREAAAVAIASDWHVGERIDPDTVSDLNEYNPQIAQARSERFFAGIATLTHLARNTSKVDQLVLGCLGDMVHGYIHEEYKENNFMSPTEEVDFFIDRWVDGIEFLLKEGGYKRIDVVCKVGNHGRTTIKNRDATEIKNSFEWLGYRALERHFGRNKRVNFIIGAGRHTYHDVMGWRVRFTHGHSIRGGNGVGGIAPPVLRAVYKWDQANRADYTVLGHFHQLRSFGHVIINGCLCGPNTWVESSGFEIEEPRQAFFLMDKERGLRMFEPIWVDDLPQLRSKAA